jgi:transposase
LLPEFLDDYVAEDNPVRVIDVFVDELDLRSLGFEGVVPEATGRPAYHPATMLKIYVYGYINQIQSSRRLERETARNVEMMWLTGRLTPDFKTIADFRKDNGPAIRSACRQFVALCRGLNLFTHAIVAIDGSRFKGRQFPGQVFFARLDPETHGAGRGEHRALSVGAGDGGPAGRRGS